MAVRRILTIDNAADLAVLKQISTPVEGPVTDELRRLMDDMLDTMYDAPGIGLAAVQIGDTRRVIVMDLNDRDGLADDQDPAELSDEDRAAWELAAIRATTSIRRSSRPPKSCSPMRKAACRCRSISTASNAPPGSACAT